jgi:hypothetical protein
VWIHPSLEGIQRGDMAASSGVGDLLKRTNVVSIQRSIPRAKVGAMMV